MLLSVPLIVCLQPSTKDVFTRMYEQRNAKDLIVQRLRFYRSLNDTVVPSVTLTRNDEQGMVKRLALFHIVLRII
jgi:hypothetical protein